MDLALNEMNGAALHAENFAGIGEDVFLLFGKAFIKLLKLLCLEGLRSLALIKAASVRNGTDGLFVNAFNDRVRCRNNGVRCTEFKCALNVFVSSISR